tara:strand:+ start:2326 stop:2709 length:384 start_codon:yes stop_codon:yes gene_type:complete
MSISYSDITKKIKNEKKIENLCENSSWTIINKKTKEIKISQSTILLKESIEKKLFKINLKKMINGWNIYRDEINELLGDISPYYNYKEEIQRMIDEDNYINELLNDNENNNDSEYSSDEENNKSLIY